MSALFGAIFATLRGKQSLGLWSRTIVVQGLVTAGALIYTQDRFADASAAFRKFLDFPSDDPAKMGPDVDRETAEVEQLLPELAFYTDFYKDPRPLDPKVLAGVSTPADEYLPMFSPDNELLFFTRLSKYQAKGDRKN